MMKPYARIATWQALREKPVWKLLAATHAPLVAGLLQTLLLDGERRLPASLLHERLERELDDLRDRGMDLPRHAKAYVRDWLNAGWLERRFPEGESEEQYELSTDAITALRFLASLDTERNVATESRLALVMQQLTQLARQTDADPQSRLEELLARRQRLDAEIEAVRGGDVEVLDEDRALERAREIIALADELSKDFRHVRDAFQQLDREFRERIIDDDRQRGDILEALFAGVDVIAESEAGRSFDAFWRLLTDARQSSELETAIDAVTSRPFASQLSRRERGFLLHLTHTLLDRGGQVHDVLQHFARSLKGFVQSNAWVEQRRLNQLLRQARAAALPLRDEVRANAPLDYIFTQSGAPIDSLSRWRLHDPRISHVDGHMDRADKADITLDNIGELVAHSEIDFAALKRAIGQTLADGRAQCSIGDVLERHPASQGLASIVGYVALGSRHGLTVAGRRELVHWQGEDGRQRAAHIPLLYFLEDRRHELA